LLISGNTKHLQLTGRSGRKPQTMMMIPEYAHAPFSQSFNWFCSDGPC